MKYFENFYFIHDIYLVINSAVVRNASSRNVRVF